MDKEYWRKNCRNRKWEERNIKNVRDYRWRGKEERNYNWNEGGICGRGGIEGRDWRKKKRSELSDSEREKRRKRNEGRRGKRDWLGEWIMEEKGRLLGMGVGKGEKEMINMKEMRIIK